MFKSIKFSDYKSFSKSQTTVIDDFKYVNIFIGKNNCGKSSVLDVISCAIDPNAYFNLNVKPKNVNIAFLIDEDELVNCYGNSYRTYTGDILRSAQRYTGKLIWSNLEFSHSGSYNLAQIKHGYIQNDNKEIYDYIVDWKKYINRLPNSLGTFIRISAERNIVPEKETNSEQLEPDGHGATNIIRKIITHTKYDENIIEKELLDALNQIMGDDAQFESIRVQEYEKKSANGNLESFWEIYLQEVDSSRFPLSQSGSGLKTIVLVLLNMIALPKINLNNSYVFGFEELENNLHPALQRRLFEYIYKYAVENKVYIFVTTHSHIAINMFFDKKHASIYHVIKENQISTIKKIDNYIDKVEILDDLDVKASDLLQANGIVWVEGPSDRIYVKKWLEIFGGKDIQEGKDFQFAYYGGRLLSHYSAEETEKADELINVLLINRNSAIIMDSDKRNRATSINETKKRVEKEFQTKKLFSWITKGKEIENYLTCSAINRTFNSSLSKTCEQYELFPEYIKEVCPNFTAQKVNFANKIKENVEDEDVLDLKIQIRRLYKTIKSWNN